MRKVLGNIFYGVSVFGILVSFVCFMGSGNPDADVDRDILVGLACLFFFVMMFVLSQKISPDMTDVDDRRNA
jgi:hypothetical protein